MSSDASRQPPPRARIVIVGAIVVAIVLWLILRGGDDDSSSTTKQASQPVPQRPGLAAVVMDRSSLKGFAAGQDQPIYWVGPRSGQRYEVTRTNDGSTYVRYLPRGVKAADPRPEFLTVGSYPNENALQVVEDAAKKEGASVAKIPGGGQALLNGEQDQANVYLAYPDVKVLIEVWAPKPGPALKLARSGAVVPVR